MCVCMYKYIYIYVYSAMVVIKFDTLFGCNKYFSNKSSGPCYVFVVFNNRWSLSNAPWHSLAMPVLRKHQHRNNIWDNWFYGFRNALFRCIFLMSFWHSNSRSDNIIYVLRLFKVKPFSDFWFLKSQWDVKSSTTNGQMCREPTRVTIAFIVVSRICDNG